MYFPVPIHFTQKACAGFFWVPEDDDRLGVLVVLVYYQQAEVGEQVEAG